MQYASWSSLTLKHSCLSSESFILPRQKTLPGKRSCDGGMREPKGGHTRITSIYLIKELSASVAQFLPQFFLFWPQPTHPLVHILPQVCEFLPFGLS